MSDRSRLRSRWLREIAAQAFLHTSVGYFATSWTVSRWLTRRSPCRIRRTPADYGLPFESIQLRAEDGIWLSGWIVEPATPRGTVALFHGMRQSRQGMLDRLAWLVGEGYRCISIDHRAHGRSRGKRSSFGFYEGRDVLAVRAAMAARWPDEPAFALGHSMGGAALCYAAQRSQPWQGVILEGVYRDLDSAFRRRIGAQYPAWFQRLSPGIIRITERRLRLRMTQLAPVECVSHFGDVPVLFVVGSSDSLAPPADSLQLCQRCLGPASVWVVPGGGHSDLLEVGGDDYRQRLSQFLSTRRV